MKRSPFLGTMAPLEVPFTAMTRRALLAGSIVSLGGVLGCTPHQEPTQSTTFTGSDPEYVMILVLDLSGSYAQYIENGRAWAAVETIVRQFFRDRAGENDKIIIAQISSQPQGPIWSGSKRAFRQELGSESAFRNLLKKYNGSSRVFDSIRESVEYALPMMGKGRAGCFIFSDMDDNSSAPGGEDRLVQAFAEFGQKGGAVGIYWCGFYEMEKWRVHLKRTVKNHVISANIDTDPQLPVWD
ncbi:MAG: hypothetical protein U0792_23980 [Gemmataceae bacterium]